MRRCEGARVNRRKAALPVVGVNDVERWLRESPVDRCRRQEGVADRVVRKVAARAVVDAVTIVELRAIEQ